MVCMSFDLKSPAWDGMFVLVSILWDDSLFLLVFMYSCTAEDLLEF